MVMLCQSCPEAVLEKAQPKLAPLQKMKKYIS
jgi:hypothetical protein